MSDEILRAHRWGTNAKMIAEAVVPLGYIEGTVLDATYGEKGGFWKEWAPPGDNLVTNDLNAPQAMEHHDFRMLPFAGCTWGTVVFDPPYKLSGTPAMREMDQRFGTAEEHAKLNREGKLAMIRAGAIECWRVTNRWLLVKVQDQVEGGIVRWQAKMVVDALEPLGALWRDQFLLLRDPIPQDRTKVQRRARSNYSTLLIFQRGGRKR